MIYVYLDLEISFIFDNTKAPATFFNFIHGYERAWKVSQFRSSLIFTPIYIAVVQEARPCLKRGNWNDGKSIQLSVFSTDVGCQQK